MQLTECLERDLQIEMLMDSQKDKRDTVNYLRVEHRNLEKEKIEPKVNKRKQIIKRN